MHLLITSFTPLRYPGGKTKIADIAEKMIRKNFSTDCTYVEPFAGGAGSSMSLLMRGIVKRVVLNDSDSSIYAFWRAAITETDKFLERLATIDLNIEEWNKQKTIYDSVISMRAPFYSFDAGFAAFYLNRTNFSGIMESNPIGGIQQTGAYKIDARFNKDMLSQKIAELGRHRGEIDIYGLDFRDFIRDILPMYDSVSTLTYFDPPYFMNGERLYRHSFTGADHVDLAYYIAHYVGCRWFATYDNCDQIKNLYSLYDEVQQETIPMMHSAKNKGLSGELMFFSDKKLNILTDEQKTLFPLQP